MLLYCTVRHCTVQYAIVLYSTLLYCTVCYCTVQQATVLYSTILYCTVQVNTLYKYRGGLAATFFASDTCSWLYCTLEYQYNTVYYCTVQCNIGFQTIKNDKLCGISHKNVKVPQKKYGKGVAPPPNLDNVQKSCPLGFHDLSIFFIEKNNIWNIYHAQQAVLAEPLSLTNNPFPPRA